MEEDYKRWLKKATRDISTAKYNLKGNKYDAASFYAQQATEKSLKAVQIKKLGKFTRTHDLLVLAESITAPKNIKEACASITPFYTLTRYPDVEERISKKKVIEILNKSAEVLKWVKETIKQ